MDGAVVPWQEEGGDRVGMKLWITRPDGGKKMADREIFTLRFLQIYKWDVGQLGFRGWSWVMISHFTPQAYHLLGFKHGHRDAHAPHCPSTPLPRDPSPSRHHTCLSPSDRRVPQDLASIYVRPPAAGARKRASMQRLSRPPNGIRNLDTCPACPDAPFPLPAQSCLSQSSLCTELYPCRQSILTDRFVISAR
jgi:hypothetical protein